VVRSTVLRLPATVLLVVLTGCIKIDLALDINENEAIDGEIILALSRELAQLTGQSREQLIGQFEADVMRDAPEGVTKESYRTEGLEGTRLILDDVPVDAFDPIEETLSIVHEGDHYVVNGMFDLAAVSDLGELSDLNKTSFEGVADTMDVRIAITFPGEVVDHNGELAGQTVTWIPTGVEAIEIYARAEDSAREGAEDSASHRSLAGPVVAALLIVSAVATLTMLRRRSSQPHEST
jgi:LppM domain